MVSDPYICIDCGSPAKATVRTSIGRASTIVLLLAGIVFAIWGAVSPVLYGVVVLVLGVAFILSSVMLDHVRSSSMHRRCDACLSRRVVHVASPVGRWYAAYGAGSPTTPPQTQGSGPMQPPAP